MSKDTLKLYSVPFWRDFPASEYGGLAVIAAEDMEGVFQVIYDWSKEQAIDDDESYPSYQDFSYNLEHNESFISKVKKIGYTDTYQQGIVSLFYT